MHFFIKLLDNILINKKLLTDIWARASSVNRLLLKGYSQLAAHAE